MNKNLQIITAAVMLTLGLTGCSTTESLSYQPQIGVARVASAENVTVNVVTMDARADKSIGIVRSGMGLKLGDISIAEPAEQTISKAIETELKSRGFSISSKSQLTVSAEIKQFRNEFHAGIIIGQADAISSFNISVKNKNEVIFSKDITGANTDLVQLSTGANAKESLQKALANAITTLFEDKAFIAALTSVAPTQIVAN